MACSKAPAFGDFGHNLIFYCKRHCPANIGIGRAVGNKFGLFINYSVLIVSEQVMPAAKFLGKRSTPKMALE